MLKVNFYLICKHLIFNYNLQLQKLKINIR